MGNKEGMEILAELIWKNWGLLFYEFDGDGNLLSWPASVEEAEKVAQKVFLRGIAVRLGQKQEPEIYTTEERNFFYWIFSRQEKYYMLGVMHLHPLTFSEERGFLHRRKIQRKDFPLKETTIAETFPVISIIYFCIAGKMFDEKVLLNSTVSDWEKFQDEMVFQKVDRSGVDHSHLSYQFERQWYQSIAEGKDRIWERMNIENSNCIDRVGMMARGDAFKQTEYTMVASITLAARAAIEGGVPPIQAYQMSDLFLQKCASCNEAIELIQIGNQAAANQLKYSEADVGEIADYLAFPSASSMGVAFKKAYGVTPLEYRKKIV